MQGRQGRRGGSNLRVGDAGPRGACRRREPSERRSRRRPATGDRTPTPAGCYASRRAQPAGQNGRRWPENDLLGHRAHPSKCRRRTECDACAHDRRVKPGGIAVGMCRGGLPAGLGPPDRDRSRPAGGSCFWGAGRGIRSLPHHLPTLHRWSSESKDSMTDDMKMKWNSRLSTCSSTRPSPSTRSRVDTIAVVGLAWVGAPAPLLRGPIGAAGWLAISPQQRPQTMPLTATAARRTKGPAGGGSPCAKRCDECSRALGGAEAFSPCHFCFYFT